MPKKHLHELLTTHNGKLKQSPEIPTIHVPLYANCFPLICGYAEAIKEWCRANNMEDSFGNLVRDKVRIQDWTDEVPRIDRNSYINVFFADQVQIDLWKKKEAFHYAKLFRYFHDFVLIKNDSLRTYCVNNQSSDCDSCKDFVSNSVRNSIKYCQKTSDLTVFLNNVAQMGSDSLKRVLIVTDVPAEAKKLRVAIQNTLSGCEYKPGGLMTAEIAIATTSTYSLHDIFVDSGRDTLKLFLFGTPGCEIFLKSKKFVSLKVSSQVMKPTETYICITSSMPNNSMLPFRCFYNYFRDVGYPIESLDPPQSSVANIEEKTSERFYKKMEVYPICIDPSSLRELHESFKDSIAYHCKLVDGLIVYGPDRIGVV